MLKSSFRNINKICTPLINYHSFIQRYASSLVIAEITSDNVSPSTLATITAANKISKDNVTLLIAGHQLKSIAVNASSIVGINKLIVVDNEILKHNIAENYAKVISKVIASNNGLTHVLAPSSNNGKNYLPRIAASMDCAPLSDVIDVVSEDTFKRPTYAGNAINTVQMKDKLKFILVRATSFEKAIVGSSKVSIEKFDVTNDDVNASKSTFISQSEMKTGRPDLSTARVVISGGRGMKSGDNFSLLDSLADKLGGAVGASRAAVDAGFVPNDYQIGQTGKVVAPDLYVAVGISGAIQHLSGMKDSKVIVAINKDKEAPIFQVADYGLVDDLFKVIPEINSKL